MSFSNEIKRLSDVRDILDDVIAEMEVLSDVISLREVGILRSAIKVMNKVEARLHRLEADYLLS
jgi:hypothetical protein